MIKIKPTLNIRTLDTSKDTEKEDTTALKMTPWKKDIKAV